MTLIPEDTTPLDPEEAAALKLSYIATRGELNAAEAMNVEAGLRWAFSRSHSVEEVLEPGFLRELHRRMFGDVWRWAGKYRRSEKNIGVPWWEVESEMRRLLLDAQVWAGGATLAWGADELGVRFHHRLVVIHPYPNGNGRHSRAAADLLVTALGGARFTWGRANLTNAGEVRTRYVEALRAADRHDFSQLFHFVRS